MGRGGKRRRAEPALTEHRFVEPPLRGLRLITSTIVAAGTSVLVSSAAGFIVLLGVSITLEEALTDVWLDYDLDPVSRMWIAVLFAIAGAVAVVWALALAADRLLLGRLLARTSASNPLDVPPAAVRRAGGRDPFVPLLALSRTLIGVAATVAVVDVLLWAETDDTVGSTVVLGACVFPIGGLLVLNGAMKTARAERWAPVATAPRAVWTRSVIAATVDAERRRGPDLSRSSKRDAASARRRGGGRFAVLGIAAIVVGAGIHFLGVAIRQPGRYADPVDYAEPGERLIDVLSLVGAGVVAVGVALLLGSVALGIVVQERERRRLLTGPIGESRGPSRDVVEAHLQAPASATTIGVAVVGAAVVAIGPLVAAAVVAQDPTHALHEAVPSILATIGALVLAAALGVVLVGAGLVRGRSFRQALRDRLHPGDDPVAPVRSSRRSSSSDAPWVPIGDASRDDRHDGDRHDGGVHHDHGHHGDGGGWGGDGGSDGGGSDGGGSDGGGGGGD